jgi:hypothetical protein
MVEMSKLGIFEAKSRRLIDYCGEGFFDWTASPFASPVLATLLP